MDTNIKTGICESADEILHDFIADSNMDTAHHRINTQDIKCGFGLTGLCCRLCANGPCRITPTSPKGVCGATPDQIVARNLLRTVSGGSASYLHVLENATWALKGAGEKKGTLRGEATLNRLCDLFEIQGEDKYAKAIKLADMILADLYKPRFEKMEMLEKLAYGLRLENWKALEIMPGGAKSEVFDALVKSSTNLNTDPMDSLLHCLTLGIATGVYGLTLTNFVNDILMGEPELRFAPVGFRVIDPDYINIMVTGHQHALFQSLEEIMATDPVKELASQLGAKGFRIVGSTCVGQDMQLRGAHTCDSFSGHAGNNFTSEAILSTGAIDLVVSEFNCTFPGLEPIAQKLRVRMLAIDDVAKKEHAELMQFSYEKKDSIARNIIKEATKSYASRRRKVKINIPKHHGNDNALTGFSEDSLKKFLGGKFDPLVDLIASGKIKGIVGIVGCSSLVSGGHDVFTVNLARELIKKDILILSAGCTSGGLSNVGLTSLEAASLAGNSLREVCESLDIPPVLNFGPCLAIGRLEMVAMELARVLNVDLPQLPLVISAPQWLEEQAVADGVYALSLGLPLHVAKPLYITGSPLVTKTLEEDLLSLTGGHLIMNDNVEMTVSIFEEIILAKRHGLGI